MAINVPVDQSAIQLSDDVVMDLNNLSTELDMPASDLANELLSTLMSYRKYQIVAKQLATVGVGQQS